MTLANSLSAGGLRCARYSRALLATLLSGLLLAGCAANTQTMVDLNDPEEQRVEPFQVFDNLYYVGAKWVSAWLLETSEGLILFDALYDDLTDITIDGIRKLGKDPNDVRYVIVTHAHFDHIGGARRFQDEFGSIVGMTEEDWQISEGEPIYRAYPKPKRHLAFGDRNTLTLGDTTLTFFKTPGHTTGVLSTLFDVRDGNRIHSAFMFGGVGLNFSGVERTQMYLDSVNRIKTIPGIAVNIPNHAESGEVFERNALLQQRQPGDPHPFVDADGFQAWLDELLVAAEAKMVEEKAAAGE